MAIRLITVDRDTAYLLPPSVQEWLPSRHLAWFVVEVVNQLNSVQAGVGLRRAWLGGASSGDAVGAADLRLRDWGVFEPGDRARHI